ncbi:MAG: hypothetical protein K0R34_2477 [Herbinix sp.]|jgi:hypothetical protein|nr:hypothetical protein [Herbinix sp.]
MYIPDNNDDFTCHEREINRLIRLNERVSADETGVSNELPWVTVQDDYGIHERCLYFEEESE